MKRRVLFVCTANSARSLMAEAVLRDMAGDRFEVASAGTAPAGPHPMALQVLSEEGIAGDGLRSKHLDELQGQHWDYVILLCERAAQECGTVSRGAQQIVWDFPDPVASNRHATFMLTLKDLRERIRLFAMVHEKGARSRPVGEDPVKIFKALADDFRLAALLLIREQGALCVCELTGAFDVPQPKVSRHLAILREAGLVAAERRGSWIYYSMTPDMPEWVGRLVDTTADCNGELIETPVARLEAMAGRPDVRCS